MNKSNENQEKMAQNPRWLAVTATVSVSFFLFTILFLLLSIGVSPVIDKIGWAFSPWLWLIMFSFLAFAATYYISKHFYKWLQIRRPALGYIALAVGLFGTLILFGWLYMFFFLVAAAPPWESKSCYPGLDCPGDISPTPPPPTKGELVHAIPRMMEEDERRTAFVRISREADAELLEMLPEDLPQETHQIDVSSSMIADLIPLPTGSFEVVPLTEREQLLPNIGYASWEWEVMAKKPGEHELALSVSLVVTDAAGNRGRQTVEVFRQNVSVTVLPLSARAIRFVEGNWQWIIGTVLALIGLYFGYQKRKKPKTID